MQTHQKCYKVETMYCDDETGNDSSSQSDDEIPIWVRGEQRWVSGITEKTTCNDVIAILLEDQRKRGKTVQNSDQYNISERWRGVEQSLSKEAHILDIWRAWGHIQSEVKLALRRSETNTGSGEYEKKQKKSNMERHRKLKKSSHHQIRTSTPKDSKTVHPNRLFGSPQDNRNKIGLSDSTDELLRLVLAQGEMIRKQLRRIRYEVRSNDNQINYHEDKAHQARMKKHGSNYLLETYLNGMPDNGTRPPFEVTATSERCGDKVHDKNSDSGVVTEMDIEQPPAATNITEEDEDEDAVNDNNDVVTEEFDENETKMLQMIEDLNSKLLKEEETLLKLHIDKKLSTKSVDETTMQLGHLEVSLNNIRAEMMKNSCELQQNAIILDEMSQIVHERQVYLSNLQRDFDKSARDHDILLNIIRHEICQSDS